MKKTGAVCTIAILLATAAASCPAQVARTEQQSSPSGDPVQGFVVHGSAHSITLPPDLQSAGTRRLRLSATDSAGSPVTFETATPSACRVSDNVVTLLSGEACTLAADRGGEGMFVSTSPVRGDFQGCIDCAGAIPTFPQWCAIGMGVVLIGLSIFQMRRSKTSVID